MSDHGRDQIPPNDGDLASSSSATAPQQVPALGLVDATVRFRGVVALDGVSLEVAQGETVGLIGPNGAGKTTLVDVVAGARQPQTGEVVFYGDRVTRVSSIERARLGLSRTFQQLSVFDGLTVREHLLLGYLSHAAREMPVRGFLSRRSAVERAVRADDSGLSPNVLLARLGLESVADELASTQAVGVTRMVDLARALASRPRLLLLDEPVSGLAEAEARAVAGVIQSIRREHSIALLVIEHNLEFAQLVADRMIALDFGQVIASGPPDEVLASGVVRDAYFGAEIEPEGPVGDNDEDRGSADASAPNPEKSVNAT
jgi:ABC-type branched-subunit amino acid transport system ATPase component